MDERLEEELSAHYHYLQNHRNLAYLESSSRRSSSPSRHVHVTPNT